MVRQSRKTTQKQLIKEMIDKQAGYFTATTIARKIQTQQASIGIATIYRYLAQARKIGSLHSYVCSGEKLYSTKQRSHCHFICEKCKKTEHIDIKNISSIDKQIAGEICHIQIDISGICKECKERNL